MPSMEVSSPLEPNGTVLSPLSGRPKPGKQNVGPLRSVTVPPDAFGGAPGRFGRKDAYQLFLLPFLTLVAWAFPDRINAFFCRSLATLLYRTRGARYNGYARIFRRLPSENGEAPPLDRLIPEAVAMRQLERLQLLRYHRPGHWAPKVRLRGKEHLDRALAAGKGAIIWVPHSPFAEVGFKMALHRNGYADWHVSRPDHGHFSSTSFGVRFLNPIRIKVEDRYLAERVVIDPVNPIPALAKLAGLLAKNRIVSITVQAFASQVTMVPFGDTTLPMPSGPAVLSMKTGAPLLPIFTERCPDGSFLVTIEAPLEAAPDASRTERVAQLLCCLTEVMYAYFRRLPAQYHFAYLHGIAESLGERAESKAAR